MIRVGIIDDEPLARSGLRRILQDIEGVEVVCEASSVVQAARVVAETGPEALFLDIHMPGATGFDLLGRLEPQPAIVFVTADSGHAVRAFEVDAVDYVLKPVEPRRLAQAVSRLQARLADHDDDEVFAPSDRLCLRTPERTIVARVSDIVCIRADGDFCRFLFGDGQSHFICHPLGYFLARLPSPPIIRLDRSLAINRMRVKKLERAGTHGSRLQLEGLAEPLVLGRTATNRLRSTLAGG
jgi:two-component system LytT family response regulator